MKDGLWSYHDLNEHDDISLHDCRATQMRVDGNDLILQFQNGFWICGHNAQNPYGQTLATDLSQLRICDFALSDIYVFHEVRLFRRLLDTRRVAMGIDRLMEQINSGGWELEFITKYHAMNAVLFHCWIWFDKPPYHRECQIALDFRTMQYSWNRICEDRPW